MAYFVHHPSLITLEDVSKSYGDEELNFDRLALEHVSISVMPGEFVIIFGPSGSGKSTLLNIMAGLELPTAGRVLYNNEDLIDLTTDQLARYHRRYMGMVFQSFNLIKSLNVWENVALPQTADGVPYRERKRRAEYLLKLFGLDRYLNRHPNELSGGEQQRMGIARALINNPSLLLVDEPTGNLDSQSADEVMRILHGLHEQAKHTIVLVTHNPEYLVYASRVVYLEDGKIKREDLGQQTETDTPSVWESATPPATVQPALPSVPSKAQPTTPLNSETYNKLRQYKLESEGAASQIAIQATKEAAARALEVAQEAVTLAERAEHMVSQRPAIESVNAGLPAAGGPIAATPDDPVTNPAVPNDNPDILADVLKINAQPRPKIVFSTNALENPTADDQIIDFSEPPTASSPTSSGPNPPVPPNPPIGGAQ